MADSEEPAEPVAVGWSTIYMTFLISFIQGAVFLCYFLRQRNKDRQNSSYDLYEPRQFTRSHRSPPPFDGGPGPFKWARAAWSVESEQLLDYVGLDAFMFLRFLRLATRMALAGTFLSFILIPIYATGNARGITTEQFNLLTMARVENGGGRLWAPLVAWFNFVAFILFEIWMEWKLFAKNRYAFLARGDMDTPPDYRYAVRIENLPTSLRNTKSLRNYFERLFPNQVRQVNVCINAKQLDKLIAERQEVILSLEKAVAFTKAKPEKPVPMTKKSGSGFLCCGGEKVEAIPYYQEELTHLNSEIDTERASVFSLASTEQLKQAELTMARSRESSAGVEVGLSGYGSNGASYDGSERSNKTQEDEEPACDGKPSATGYVTFTSLRAKQAALQVEISGRKDVMDMFAASEPSGVIWENCTAPYNLQRVLEMAVSCFWIVGILFWAVPVGFVTSIANLNGILTSFGLPPANANAAWYGLVAGLLPVIFLAILMAVLYMAINMAATKIIKKKSRPEVDAYAIFWHQCFQFANLWLILISGSLFSQLDSITTDPTKIFDVLAEAVPGASTFFLSMIIVGSFGAFGLELSGFVTHLVSILMSFIQPEEARTQRTLDEAKKPPSLVWGQVIPRIVFIYLVTIIYCPIVPLVEFFSLIYFGGSYLVYKHQFLHVYATEFEGGGDTTWNTIFTFLMVCIYMSEFVFVAFMGIKEAPLIAGLGFIPLIITVFVHVAINRNIRKPLEYLSLEAASQVDIDDGEQPLEAEASDMATAVEAQLYGQPSLKASEDEREAMPYRREECAI